MTTTTGRATTVAAPSRAAAVLDAVVDGLDGRAPHVVLDSGDGTGPRHVALLTGPRLVDDGMHVHLDGQVVGDDPFAVLDDVAAAHGLGPTAHASTDQPLGAGLVGVLSYDLARRIEDLTPPGGAAPATDDRDLPLLDLTLSEVAVTVAPDGTTRVVVDDRGGAGVAGATDLARAAAAAARRAVPTDRDTRDPSSTRRSVAPTSDRETTTTTGATSTASRDEYLDAVARVLDHIAAGDTFQVNLSHRLTGSWPHGPVALYRALRAASPAPHGALARLGEAIVASISPETFLVVRGRDVVTRPIKGTRPRHVDDDADRALAHALLASAKDRAENVMVVDMERNDLGRVCEVGSIRVPTLCELEAHPTVWHLVSTVTGRLRPDVGWGGLLRATFPCGSVTGTPKVRAMQVIEALEPVRRHAYCGAVGHLGDGRLDLSVAIRTAVLLPDGRVDYGAGGGIVADSDPSAEHDETMAKAAAFLSALAEGPR